MSQLVLVLRTISAIHLQHAKENHYVSYSQWLISSTSMLHVLAIEPVIEEDPCEPNPCGQYSNPPRNVGGRCDCSCLPGMIGSPPNCRPECLFNQDCPDDKACKNQKCVDPCPGLCGINANCKVRNHIPICVCNRGYAGDPFSQCRLITSKG